MPPIPLQRTRWVAKWTGRLRCQMGWQKPRMCCSLRLQAALLCSPPLLETPTLKGPCSTMSHFVKKKKKMSPLAMAHDLTKKNVKLIWNLRHLCKAVYVFLTSELLCSDLYRRHMKRCTWQWRFYSLFGPWTTFPRNPFNQCSSKFKESLKSVYSSPKLRQSSPTLSVWVLRKPQCILYKHNVVLNWISKLSPHVCVIIYKIETYFHFSSTHYTKAA